MNARIVGPSIVSPDRSARARRVWRRLGRGLTALGILAAFETLAAVPLDSNLQEWIQRAGSAGEIRVEAEFDPPDVVVGETAIYRLVVTAPSEAVSVPSVPALADGWTWRRGARGATAAGVGGVARPYAVFNFRVVADLPGTHVTTPATITANGRPFDVPAAQLVVRQPVPGQLGHPARLAVELPQERFFVGRAIRVLVVALDDARETVLGLSNPGADGDGFIIEHVQGRQRRETRRVGGRPVGVVLEELSLVPIRAGALTFAARSFALVSRSEGGGIQLPGFQPLLESDPVTLRVDHEPGTADVKEPASSGSSGVTAASGNAKAVSGALAEGRPRGEGGTDAVAGLPVGVLAIGSSGRASWVSRGGETAFMAFQAVAAIALTALWGWDRRRRFFAEHPWKVVERRARRKAGRELRRLRRAEAEGDSAGFILAAAAALREASAPRTGAMATSLVGEDVLRALPEGERFLGARELVRSVFAAADLVRFRGEWADGSRMMELRMAIESLVATLLSRPLRR